MSEAANLIANAQFAQLDEDGVPADWELNRGNPATAPTLEIVERAGTRWASFTMRPEGTAMSRLSQTIDLSNAGEAVRVTVEVRCEGRADPRRHALVRMWWLDQPRAHEGWPPWIHQHFLVDTAVDGQTSCLERVLPLPEHATQVRLDLVACWSPGGKISFGRICLEPCSPPPPRRVRLAVVQGTPPRSTTEQACTWATAQIQQAALLGADLVCLGEIINSVNISESPGATAETIPGGPVATALSQAAARYGLYVVAGLYELVGEVWYNSAVLFNRTGQVSGVYRDCCKTPLT